MIEKSINKVNTALKLLVFIFLFNLSKVLLASCRSLSSTAENDIKAEHTRQSETATINVYLMVSLLFITLLALIFV